MAEFDTPYLSDDEISRLADALEVWVARHPFPDHPAFSFGQTGPFSPRQIANGVRERIPPSEFVVRMVQFATEVESFESILMVLRDDRPEPMNA